MEMRAVEEVAIGQDLTPPIPPIAAALHDSRRFSHCSACFSLLPSAPTLSTHHVPASFLRYCSPRCSSLDTPLHFSSAEFHLLCHSSAIPDTSDLRLSLRLLRRFQILRLLSGNDSVLDRIGGLMTNRAELLMTVESSEDVVTNEVFGRIKEGARAMATARRRRDGLNSESPLAGDCNLEEAVLCLVLTNAVEVQDSAGCSIGIAVYGPSFSWIYHGCSPNCSYRFSTIPCSISASHWLIHPKYTDCDGGNGGSEEECGPGLIVRSIKDIKKGEEVLITYTDLLQPKGMRQSELWLKYRFRCCCDRCNDETYADHILEWCSGNRCREANGSEHGRPAAVHDSTYGLATVFPQIRLSIEEEKYDLVCTCLQRSRRAAATGI